MPKIVFVGAGSTIFARNLIGDLLSHPELADCHLSLHDIDGQRLRTSELVAQRLAASLGVQPVLQATSDRRTALDGADYVITMFQVAGYKPGTVVDFEVPKRYGLRQTIGDTLGIGGIMRGLRTLPVLLDVCRDMEELCPDALLLNYVNPMAMLCWGVCRGSTVRTIGLCHSVQGTIRQLANDLALPAEEINYLCAGINHMAFYLTLEHQGRDLYPQLYRLVDQGDVPDWNRVRYEVLARFGYFVTESSEHFAEYVPWFIKRDRPDLLKRFNIPLDEYLQRCERQLGAWEVVQSVLEGGDEPTSDQIEEALDGTPPSAALQDEIRHQIGQDSQVAFSGEYASEIIHSIESGQPRVVYGNVPNHGLIDNLPADCIVEVPCLVDANGVQPTRIGALPPHLAALIQTNVNVQALTVEAALSGKREHIYHAAMLDPHTAAELDLDQIWQLVDDLVEAHGGWLPDYH
jgi:alpha-galactosidase